MQIVRDLSEVKLNSRSILTIGTYDGIHLGHQKIFADLVEAARVHRVPSVMVTLHPHPRAVLAPHLPPPQLLTTLEEKTAVIESLGLDIMAILPFTREFAQTPARDFLAALVAAFHPLQIWEGYDFVWGRNREGDIDLLRQLGQEFDFEVRIIEAQKIAGEVVSSTGIRHLLREGKVHAATQMLGRYPSLQGQVIQGAHRGHSIGFPTANLAIPAERLLPARGVYAVFAWLGERRFLGVANIGIRPSFNETTPTVEVFIFDFAENIYGQLLKIDLVAFLRPEMKFPGIEALVAQIDRDAAQARQILMEELARAPAAGVRPGP